MAKKMRMYSMSDYVISRATFILVLFIFWRDMPANIEVFATLKLLLLDLLKILFQ